MKNFLVWATTFLILAFSGVSQAQDSARGAIMRVTTRPGVVVPLYVVWRNQAVATVVLFSGSKGGFGKPGDDGWPDSGNFLIRTGKMWASQPFNIVMVGRPSDGIDLGDGAVRIGAEHGADNVAIYKAVKSKSNVPLWVVGTSMGTISAVASAVHDTDGLISGLVLTSSVTSSKRAGAVPTQDLSKIRVPTLVVHHEKDACKICVPSDARTIAGLLVNAPIRKTVMLNGGSGATGNPCEGQHYHGFIGMESAVVAMISAWILHPAS
ncbi:alpha/beta hydrolase [Eoetvoesiella caeni]|uniref:Alpha/beta hydrolase n=1 Tax=Eoetvoesiella caeni TaxID=645616 RepID=A0A366HG15_9BURK|nr:alpha/beta hydrolase [Eoetvoesiella caeni]MCI2808557.1 alpha/beta hydrolase [Eoetvoesiella caeni]NYT55097.1 alpha/beta hydrolase [Eoetvoesiella caeni]RBP40923.1 hypothetical protein DFR37_103266 [Eoetvoesiella caeni]